MARGSGLGVGGSVGRSTAWGGGQVWWWWSPKAGVGPWGEWVVFEAQGGAAGAEAVLARQGQE